MQLWTSGIISFGLSMFDIEYTRDDMPNALLITPLTVANCDVDVEFSFWNCIA